MAIKNIVLGALLCVISTTINGQNDFSFEYDEVGNRTSRELITLKTMEVTNDSTIEEGVHGMIGETYVQAFPNPNIGSIVLRVESESIEKGYYVLIDMRGRIVNEGKFEKGETYINMEYEPAGEYILVLRSGDYKKEIMIVKQ